MSFKTDCQNGYQKEDEETGGGGGLWTRSNKDD